MSFLKAPGFKLESPQVDKTWGVWGSSYSVPKGILNLLNRDYSFAVVEPWREMRAYNKKAEIKMLILKHMDPSKYV